MFCKAEVNQIRCINEILAKYEICSGQRINLDKSSIFFSKNAKEEDRKVICEELRGVKEQKTQQVLRASFSHW